MNLNYKRVWITGDQHGDFRWLADWCKANDTDPNEDLLITLGDAGFMYYGPTNRREKHIKEEVGKCPITILNVRGNHEARPEDYENIEFIELESDPIVPSGYYFEPEYPNILYAADGSTFDINDKRCLFIGGAFSVDKEWRLLMNWRWFENEELTTSECLNILDKIDHKTFDFVFTHTCPFDWMPTDLFMNNIDQSKVSNHMEHFLTTVSQIIDFKEWWFGHFHDDRVDMDVPIDHPGQGKVSMLYREVRPLLNSNI